MTFCRFLTIYEASVVSLAEVVVVNIGGVVRGRLSTSVISVTFLGNFIIIECQKAFVCWRSLHFFVVGGNIFVFSALVGRLLPLIGGPSRGWRLVWFVTVSSRGFVAAC